MKKEENKGRRRKRKEGKMGDIGTSRCRIIVEHLKNAERENVTITIENLLRDF